MFKSIGIFFDEANINICLGTISENNVCSFKNFNFEQKKHVVEW